jgi:hypothetical protein
VTKIKVRMLRVLLATFLAFAPTFLIADMAHANCVSPGQEEAVAAAQQAETSSPTVVTFATCGGDDTSYQIPLSVDITFDGQVFENIYVTTNSVITFGRPDGTYWTYPSTPSISLYSMDWVVYPGWRGDEHLIISSSDGGFQVDISARPIWLQNAESPTNIIITAAILSDGTVAMAYSLDGPTYDDQTRTGIRLNDGTIVDFETYGIDQVTESPELSPEPTTESPFVPEPTQSPTASPEPTPELPVLNEPTNLTGTQLEDGSVQLMWNPPTQSNTIVERYAVSWSIDNFQTGWGVASTTNSITLNRDLFATTGGLDQTYQFRIRSDNDTEAVYSSFSQTASVLVIAPPPLPIIPEGATVYGEGSVAEIIAPEGQRIATILGYYGDPNDSRNGLDISPVLAQFAGTQSAIIEANNSLFTDPAPGIVKIMILLVTFENIVTESPVVEPTPSPTPQPEPQPEPAPEPQPEPAPEPQPEPAPEPQPPIENPSIIEPEPLPTQEPVEEPTVEPSPEPAPEPQPEPTIPPAEEPTPEPTPSEEPIEEPTENEPESLPEPEQTETPEPREPELPVKESSEIIQDLGSIDSSLLTDSQVEQLLEAAFEIFETAEQGSEEYEQALEALMIAATADDLELPQELAAIPLLGDIAGAALEVFNDVGNIGADMSPQVREDAEKTVIASVIAVQAAVSAVAAATTMTASSGTRRI